MSIPIVNTQELTLKNFQKKNPQFLTNLKNIWPTNRNRHKTEPNLKKIRNNENLKKKINKSKKQKFKKIKKNKKTT